MDTRHLWVAVIAGGQGTRLFPISHMDRPKQFCQLNQNNTFIQAAIQNFTNLGIKPSQIVIVTTNSNQTRLAKEQTLKKGILSQNIYQLHPNLGYAAAMCQATKFIAEIDPEAIVINTPSDQYISTEDDEFANAIKSAVADAKKGHAVIVGVKVNDLVTATGCGHALYKDDDNTCHDVTGFVEKPGLKEADRIMRAGNSACNTGINVWEAKTFLKSIQAQKIKGMTTDQLMDSLDNLKIAVGSFEWHDCGTLKSLYEISKKTPNHKNASLGSGSFERVDCRRSLLYAAEGMELRVTGARDDAVIFTTINEKPIVVVAKLSESQRIKALAEDYAMHEDFLTDDFSFGARNNIVLGSNISDELIVGFVGVKDYAVYVHKKPDCTLEAAVSQQLAHDEK